MLYTDVVIIIVLNRSAEFTSKPGLCPSGGVSGSLGNDPNPSGSVCTWDIDCPGWQKCCQNENIIQCSDPLLTGKKTFIHKKIFDILFMSIQ